MYTLYLEVGNARHWLFTVIRPRKTNRTQRAQWPGRVWTHFGSTLKKYFNASVWRTCPEQKGVQSTSSKGWGAAPTALFWLVPPLTAPALLMGCKPDKPTAPGSNILLTKRKRKYVQLLLSSGVGGCYRTRWFKLVFHLPGWRENTACSTTSTVAAALPIGGWQWFWGAVAPPESRGPKVPHNLPCQGWERGATSPGLSHGGFSKKILQWFSNRAPDHSISIIRPTESEIQ